MSPTSDSTRYLAPLIRRQDWALRFVRVVLMSLPLIALARHALPLSAPPNPVDQTVGVLALSLTPGYVLLSMLKLDPLAKRAPSWLWGLVVPLSLAIDTVLGTFLVMTPIGLSQLPLWTSISIWTLVVFGLGVLRR